MTETLMNVSNPYQGERRAGTVGFPLPGVEVRLAPDGEILVRGPNVFAGYREKPRRPPPMPSSPTLDDGPIALGSGPVISAPRTDGYLVIRGRTKELIISGGYNVYPAEVEDVLSRSSPGGRGGRDRNAVRGVGRGGHRLGGGRWAAALPRRPGPPSSPASAGRLQAAAWSVHVVAELPRNALGKVIKSRLGT